MSPDERRHLYRLRYADGTHEDVQAPTPSIAVAERMTVAMPQVITDMTAVEMFWRGVAMRPSTLVRADRPRVIHAEPGDY